jgi:hypothetical protein
LLKISPFRAVVLDTWKEVENELKKHSEIRPYWSEADLVHWMSSKIQQGLQERRSNAVVHVAPYLGTDEGLYGRKAIVIKDFLKEYNKVTRSTSRKLAPDIIVVNPKDASDFVGCVEVKLLLGTNFWESRLSSVKDDYHRVRLLKKCKVFPESFLAVAFDPQDSARGQQKELSQKLDALERRYRSGFVLRYGC